MQRLHERERVVITAKEEIAELVNSALNRGIQQGKLAHINTKDLGIERPHNPDHGDFACSLPLKLAKSMQMDPLSIAHVIGDLIEQNEVANKVQIARPGFINFSLDNSWLVKQLAIILEENSGFGHVNIGSGQKVQVEFVSANPTGPLHVAHARGAVVGSTLANILESASYSVVREYYFNDAGNQINQFHLSLFARYRQLHSIETEMPKDGYQGDYVIDIAKEIKNAEGDRFLTLDEDNAVLELGDKGLKIVLTSIKEDLQKLRIQFDSWFSENSLHENGQFDATIDLLREKGYVSEKDGAVWFLSTKLGEEKDNVLIRKTGVPTYFGTDVAYHYNKFFERKFHRVINVWGADHHGQAPRLNAAMHVLGVPTKSLDILFNQMVTFRQADSVKRLSKRKGDIITIRELLDEVGTDACRFFFLSRSADSQLEFDLELAKQQSSENPVYYIQYAHARICGILKLASQQGLESRDGDASLLQHKAELALIRKMILLPEIIEVSARNLEPHHLPHYAIEVASAFHWFYQQCRVLSPIPEERMISAARLKLIEATKIVLANTLTLMNMEAPNTM